MALNDRSGPLRTNGPAHPESQQLAAYVDGMLSPSDRVVIEAHLTECNDCRAVLADTMAFLTAEADVHVPTTRARPHRMRAAAIGIGAALAAAAALLLVVRLPGSQWIARWTARPAERPELQALVAALAKEPTRLVEGRLSGGFSYKAPPSATRGTNDPTLSPEVRIAAAELERRAITDESAPAQAALGLALLIQGQLNRAVETLEDVVQTQPANGFYQNDLASAYIARAQREDRPDDFPRALMAAERALKANPILAEAWFNRALALEKLGLREQASASWREAAQHQIEEGWRAEALRRADDLSKPPAALDWERSRPRVVAALASHDSGVLQTLRQYRELAREWVEDVALSKWGEARLAGNPTEASAQLDEARLVARALPEAGGDAMPLAGVDAIDALGPHDVKKADNLATAHVAFARARAAWLAGKPAESAALLQPVVAYFEAAGSPYQYWEPIYRAGADATRGNSPAALEALRTIPAGARLRFRYLDARACWLLGVRLLVTGDLDRAGEQYRAALRKLEDGGEDEGVIAMYSVLAEYNFYLGNLAETWRLSGQALRRLDQARTIGRQSLAVNLPGFFATWQDLPEAALQFQNAYVALTQRLHDSARAPEALLNRAQTLSRLGDNLAAQADLRAAETALAAVADAGRRDWFGNDLRMVRGLIAGRESAPTAISDLATALAHFTTRDAQRTVRLHLELGRLNRRLGHLDAARQEFLAGIRAFEDQRAHWTSEQTRVSSFDEAWSLFDEMVYLEATQPAADARRSLEIAERGRGLALLETLEGEPARQRPSLARIQEALPGNVHVAFYCTLADRIVIWHVTRAAIEQYTTNLRRPLFEIDVRRFVDAVKRRDVEAIKLRGGRLFEQVLGPLYGSLGAGTPLVVVGDGLIQQIPFAALSTPTGRFVIEDRPVAAAPSLSMLVDQGSTPTAARHRNRALVVASPATGGPFVAALPYAAREADRVARLYPEAETLTGTRATTAEFLDSVSRHDIVHFAGHSVVNQMYPTLSYLQLSPDVKIEDMGRLFSGDLTSHLSRRARLIVLASCGSAAGRPARGEGVLSLSRPFLAAGASAVVSTLWAIDDASAEPLFVRFHERYRLGDSPVEAIRHAQLETLATGGPRAAITWGAVMISGRVSGLFETTRS